MSFANHAITSLKSNRRLRKHNGYFKTKGNKISSEMRIGTNPPVSSVNKNAYQLTQERKVLMRKKGIRDISVFGVSFLILVYVVVWLMG